MNEHGLIETGSAEVAPGRSRFRVTSQSISRLVRTHWIGYVYLLPAAALYAIFVIYPLMQGAWISLFDWDGFSPATWVGLENYRSVLTDPDLREAFSHSIVLLVFYSVIPLSLGLLITAIISSRPMRGASAYRAILFLPQVLPVIAIGITWRWMFAPDGPINAALTAIGRDDLARGWLGDFTWALPAVGLVGSWASFGFVMILLLAGVQQISRDLYDAARVDGAGRVQEFFAVTLPGLRNQLVVAAMITVISAFSVFGLIFVMTTGGPGTTTTVPAWQVYRRAFTYGDVGSAAAVGLTLAVLIFLAVFVLNRMSERDVR